MHGSGSNAWSIKPSVFEALFLTCYFRPSFYTCRSIPWCISLIDRVIGRSMSRKLLSRFLGFFSSRNLAGVDKHGNRYFTRSEEVDGISKRTRSLSLSLSNRITRSCLGAWISNFYRWINLSVDFWAFFSLLWFFFSPFAVLSFLSTPVKEKRWVIFKGEEDPTSIPGQHLMHFLYVFL